MMEDHNLVTTATATRKLVRPYRPGYLALTVGPILEDVVQALSLQPNIVIVNAAGRDTSEAPALRSNTTTRLDPACRMGFTDNPESAHLSRPTAQELRDGLVME
jgi:hypothetical protein